MEKSDWEKLVSAYPKETLKGIIWRVVESQEEAATTKLVDTLEKQDILERLLDSSKPPYPKDSENLHYLLTTPFRYPPLQWGSRFGGRHEPSLYYGSYEIETALAEKAYYQMVFWQGMEVPPIAGKLVTQHTLFSINFAAHPGINLHTALFEPYQTLLCSRTDYTTSQLLGTVIREKGFQGISFKSARCPKGGLNAALLTPKAIVSKKPIEEQSWLCEVRENGAILKGSSGLYSFGIELFCENGAIPIPAH